MICFSIKERESHHREFRFSQNTSLNQTYEGPNRKSPYILAVRSGHLDKPCDDRDNRTWLCCPSVVKDHRLIMSMSRKFIPLLFLVVGCSAPNSDSPPIAGADESPLRLPEVNWTKGETSTENAPTTGEFQVEFQTTAGDFTMLVHRDWAPRGAERMYQLIKSHYYDGAPFYRVVPGFMVQFGMNGDPQGTQYWDVSFPDDPVTQSNQVKTVSFATSGPNTRSTQLFINYGDNARLDRMGFSPFAEIVEGMNNVNAINSRYGEKPDQGQMTAEGNEYVFRKFSRIDYIISATFADQADTSDAP